ncbi:MAG: SLC13 family permease [Desulfobacterales bacterium]|nr:SLC13 family permease [Desulfobacterales bacterium]
MIKSLRHIIIGFIVFSALTSYLFSLFSSGANEPTRAAAVVIFALGFWATTALPEYLTAIMFFLFALVLKIAPPNVVFSGFHSKALWLVFGGLIIGVAVNNTGLGPRFARRILSYMSTSYLLNISIIVFTAILFSFFMPSTTGRVVLLVPVVAAISDRLGFNEGSKGRSGMVMAATLACFAPSCAILPANVANMILAGAAEKVYNIDFRFVEYFKWQFPILVMKAIAIILLARFLFPARIELARNSCKTLNISPISFSGSEKRLAFILAATLFLWATDTLHGISPAWVAMAAGVACFIPFFQILPAESFRKEINFSLLFYVAGVLGVGALVDSSGLGQAMGNKLLTFIKFYPALDFYNFICIVIVEIALSLVTTVPGLPAVMTPLAQEISNATGFHLQTVIMTQVIGFSTLIFPYQVPPILVGMNLGAVRGVDGVKITASLALVTLIFIVPTLYLWWLYLGFFR